MYAVKASEDVTEDRLQFDVKQSPHKDIIKDFHVPACRRPTGGAICELGNSNTWPNNGATSLFTQFRTGYILLQFSQKK